ncbi:MAG: heterodisulfide reductase-related iron-sulfur binding cluster [Pseudomonadota bacterium]
MQTNFTAEQLADPRIAEANAILRTCVHCGLCQATCPTYLVQGDERDSPRGRIYLMKDMFEGAKPASNEVSHHIDRCLSCLSCMTTCPSGVDYMHLVDLARAHVEDTGERPARTRLMRALIAAVVPYPGRFRLALLGALVAKPFAGVVERLGLRELAAMLRLAQRPRIFPRARPRRQPIKSRRASSTAQETATAARGRVLFLEGCAQPVLRPETNAATIRLIERLGYEVVIARGAGCCGALTAHMGRETEGRAHARRTIRAWIGAMQDAPIDAIVVNASGCGTTVKDYGHMFADADPETRAQAERISELTMDISEFLASAGVGAPERFSSLRVAYHSACSLQHGQQLNDPPRDLLRKAGFSIVEVPEGHICCGSAGTYNMLQPELSGKLRARKVANIERVTPDLVATGNIGCMTQLAGGLDVPVVHTVELLDWAYGGPVPRGLEGIADRVVNVPEEARAVGEVSF